MECIMFLGDIVDAKDRFQIGSEQYIEEWEIYQKILEDSGVAKKTEWLEVRGNHGIISKHFVCKLLICKPEKKVIF